MEQLNIKNIIDSVYPLISKDYNSNAKVEIHSNIYERLSGVKGMNGSACAQAEYDWSKNTIYLYTSRLFDEEDVIRALIHECVHSLQTKEVFDEYYEVGCNYKTHPYEIEARKAEEKWYKYKITREFELFTAYHDGEITI